MKESTTSERLRKLMDERGLRQTDILELCRPICQQYGKRLGKNDLSQYLSGKVVPKQDKLSILALALGVSEAWLMGYDVSQKRESLENTRGKENETSFVLDANTEKHLAAYLDLTADRRSKVDAYTEEQLLIQKLEDKKDASSDVKEA